MIALLVVAAVLYPLAGVLAATLAVLAYDQPATRRDVVLVVGAWPVFAVLALAGDLAAFVYAVKAADRHAGRRNPPDDPKRCDHGHLERAVAAAEEADRAAASETESDQPWWAS